MVTRLLLALALLVSALPARAGMFFQLSATRVVSLDELAYANTALGVTTFYYANGVSVVLTAPEQARVTAWLALRGGNPAPGEFLHVAGTNLWLHVPKIVQLRHVAGNNYAVDFAPLVSVSLTGAQALDLANMLVDQIYDGPPQ